MTVGELIAHLLTFDPDIEVRRYKYDEYWYCSESEEIDAVILYPEYKHGRGKKANIVSAWVELR